MKIKSITLAVLTALILTGCATIESFFFPTPPPKAPAPPPPPPVKSEPATPPSQKEPEAPPPQTEPAAPSPKKEPETPPAKREPPPPPVKPPKKEAPPPPVKREPPSPPPKKETEPLPAAIEPEIPPPVLAPQVGDEEQLKREAGSRLQRTEQLIGQLEEKKLTGDQKEQLLTIRSLLDNAKEAFATRDLAKASNLADKARVLGEELARGIR